MAVTGPTPTSDSFQTLFRSFLLQVLPQGSEVIVAQTNRVPEPQGPNFVLMGQPDLKRLATTVDTWPVTSRLDPPPTAILHQQDVQVRVQLDVHGPAGMDNANLITTLLRSPYGVDFFNPKLTGIAPLWCDDARQIPFVSGENQYEDRWIIEAFFEMTVAVSTTQQFADTLTVGIKEVDTFYPP